MRTLANLAAVDAASRRCAESGLRVLNAHLFADTEAEHVDVLLGLIQPKVGAVILDAGCGFGETARLMREARPDLFFKLVNASRAQLAECPLDMELIEADYTSMPVASGSVDVVMFNYAICHAPDWVPVLREANRVLREGGTLFINDMLRQNDVGNELMELTLGGRAHTEKKVAGWARQAGFELLEGIIHTGTVQRMRGVFQDAALYDCIMDGVVPATWRFTKKTVADPIESAFARHERIGFQFSGGRDSTAALFLLRDYWDRMTVYHLDTGDQFPETRAVVDAVEKLIPIVRIHTDVKTDRLENGMPVDLIPVDNTPLGRKVSGRSLKLTGRYDCCWRNLMQPMHQKLIGDGITLIVRGQRDDEYQEQPTRSGDYSEGIEVLYPLQDWTADNVMLYLKGNELPLAEFYDRGMRRAPECMGCTAWWDEGRENYLRQYHPIEFAANAAAMGKINAEIVRQRYSHLNCISAPAVVR